MNFRKNRNAFESTCGVIFGFVVLNILYSNFGFGPDLSGLRDKNAI